ncbi:hypothetical protein QQX10_08100 [Demequina sp. SYSU T00039]|uniref:V-type ATP synthase subunit F n=1 Tax=Demequina lignilytica TaxID=3051663 RepID=A0AAW7M112_9MICO|nr:MULTISPECIES: V-type ATP synthase subunit F [unclassified Demequina]MDN4477521.1 hypothetical protein [Demequina sp. SYSU T00039-1]MDN4488128.1 hypothetical protein [Demequina sp. SYSU T00039]MDN4490569.1 hypothetical protein [Demequina sp. SYSU T00068]
MNAPAPLLDGVVVAIGDRRLVGAYALAGVDVRHAPDPGAVRLAWEALAQDVALVVLTADAAAALGGEADRLGAPVTAVIPT